jgi:hypothetical protein
MFTSVIALMASAFLATDSAAPAMAAPAAAPAAAVSKHDKNKMVCRNAAPTGTRLGNRTCHTQGEWDDISAEHQKLIREQQMEHQTNRQE